MSLCVAILFFFLFTVYTVSIFFRLFSLYTINSFIYPVIVIFRSGSRECPGRRKPWKYDQEVRMPMKKFKVVIAKVNTGKLEISLNSLQFFWDLYETSHSSYYTVSYMIHCITYKSEVLVIGQMSHYNLISDQLFEGPFDKNLEVRTLLTNS